MGQSGGGACMARLRRDGGWCSHHARPPRTSRPPHQRIPTPVSGRTGEPRRGPPRAASVDAGVRPVLAPTAAGQLRAGLRRLLYGHRPAAVAFQAGLLALDLAALAYFLTTTFVADAPWIRAVDLLLGVLLALEFLGRLAAHRHPMRYL